MGGLLVRIVNSRSWSKSASGDNYAVVSKVVELAPLLPMTQLYQQLQTRAEFSDVLDLKYHWAVKVNVA